MTKPTIRFEIECGERHILKANSPQEAWRQFSKVVPENKRGGLVRFREKPWNTRYTWDKKLSGHSRPGQWYCCDPCWFGTTDT